MCRAADEFGGKDGQHEEPVYQNRSWIISCVWRLARPFSQIFWWSLSVGRQSSSRRFKMFGTWTFPGSSAGVDMSGRYRSSTDLASLCDLSSTGFFFLSSSLTISTVVMNVAESAVSCALPAVSAAFSAGLIADWCWICCEYRTCSSTLASCF